LVSRVPRPSGPDGKRRRSLSPPSEAPLPPPLPPSLPPLPPLSQSKHL